MIGIIVTLFSDILIEAIKYTKKYLKMYFLNKKTQCYKLIDVKTIQIIIL